VASFGVAELDAVFLECSSVACSLCVFSLGGFLKFLSLKVFGHGQGGDVDFALSQVVDCAREAMVDFGEVHGIPFGYLLIHVSMISGLSELSRLIFFHPVGTLLRASCMESYSFVFVRTNPIPEDTRIQYPLIFLPAR
jgi:hypothetical protein